MAEPYEVCIKGSDKIIGYACPKCRLFCSPTIYFCKWNDALKAARDQAIKCCGPRLCTKCGKDMGEKRKVHWLACEDCRRKTDAEREKRRFEEAEKIPWEKYEHGFLYYADKFYDDMDSLLDSYDEGEEPEYVWACYPVDFTMDAQDIVSSEIENQEHHEDAFSEVSDKMLERLQKYLDLWCKKVGVRTWMPDFKKAVLLTTTKRG